MASHGILYSKLSDLNESKKLWEDRGNGKIKVGCTKDNKGWHCLDSANLYQTPVIPKVSNILRNSDESREESIDIFLRFSCCTFDSSIFDACFRKHLEFSAVYCLIS
jgi:hypothetical protein